MCKITKVRDECRVAPLEPGCVWLNSEHLYNLGLQIRSLTAGWDYRNAVRWPCQLYSLGPGLQLKLSRAKD